MGAVEAWDGIFFFFFSNRASQASEKRKGEDQKGEFKGG